MRPSSILLWITLAMRSRRSDERPTSSGKAIKLLALTERTVAVGVVGIEGVCDWTRTTRENTNTVKTANARQSFLIMSAPRVVKRLRRINYVLCFRKIIRRRKPYPDEKRKRPCGDGLENEEARS